MGKTKEEALKNISEDSFCAAVNNFIEETQKICVGIIIPRDKNVNMKRWAVTQFKPCSDIC